MTSIRAARFNWAPCWTAVKVASSADANVADDAVTQYNVKAANTTTFIKKLLSAS